ncbi:MAG: hypothetical protein L6R39_006923 [Caloplaca ligustica]|nr:MAG: hypothetical protein L6R39_006923 [Caloplaca ligustica]
MHFLRKLALLATAASQLAIVASAPTPVEVVERTNLHRRASNTVVNGRLFTIDGRTQYFAGTNTWWLGHLWSNADVDTALTQIAATGYKVARVWGFGTVNNPSTSTDVYYQILNSTGQYFNYNANNGIARLDYAISAAEKKGIKLILPLLNNYDDLGGINTYTNVYGGSHNDFYTNTAAQNAYKNYIKFIVNRYKASTAIFSWELCNEPRCSGCASSIITNWATTISAYIKSLDPAHLVSLGDEGWLTSTSSYVANYEQTYAYTGYEGVDFEKNLAIKTIDYGTVHMYPNQWGYNYAWGNTWIAQHNQIGKKLCKPVLLQEYAVPDGENRIAIEGPWQDTVVSKTSIAGDMMWQFGTKFPSGTNPFDNYALYYNTSDYQTLGNQHAKVMAEKWAVANL